MNRFFFDSNILLYTINEDDRRNRRSTDLLSQGGVISVQCLNEFVSVARRKLRMAWAEIEAAKQQVLTLVDPVVPVTLDVHQYGVALADRYMFSVYDAFVVAAALQARCDVLWSEDMHHDLLVEGRLRIRNPFLPG